MSSPAWTLGSWVRIPLEAWMFVCVYSVCVVLCRSGLAPGWSLVQGVLPIVYKCKITEPHKEEAKARYGLERHIIRTYSGRNQASIHYRPFRVYPYLSGYVCSSLVNSFFSHFTDFYETWYERNVIICIFQFPNHWMGCRLYFLVTFCLMESS
jgi:hypothetical protein